MANARPLSQEPGPNFPFSTWRHGTPLWTGSLDGCRERVAKVVCLVEPGSDIGAPPYDRTCLPSSASYAPLFLEVYDRYPAILQKMFCRLDRIFIEKQFSGSAYADVEKDLHGKSHVVIGFRQSELDAGLGLTQVASWKEQLSFGGDPKNYFPLLDGMPVVTSVFPPGVNDLIYYVVAHEFGHLFDAANQLNLSFIPSSGDKLPHAGEWTRISWGSDGRPLAEESYPGREKLCFYNCQGNFVAKSEVAALYEAYYAHSSFITTYGSTDPLEDWAESLAMYVAASELHSQYLVEDGAGHAYDVMAKLRSPAFATKYRFIADFLKRTDLLYP